MKAAFLRRILMLALIVVADPAVAERGALVVSRNLDQLTDRAAQIVRGNVTSARLERHPELGLHMVVVTMRVRETLKGPAQSTMTFRQYVWDIRDRTDLAGYRKGQDLLLLMIEPSRYGLSSPAGLGQGRFHIRRDAEGREVAVNGHGNFRLFDGIDAGIARKGIALSSSSSHLIQAHRSGPVAVGELTGLIRELSAGSP